MAARNILGANFDLWKLQGESEYLEEGVALSDQEILELEKSQPRVPERV